VPARDVQSLFRENHLSLLRFLRRRGIHSTEAADIAQDAFMRLLSTDPTAQIGNLRAYLFAIARNLSVNHQRRQRIAPFIEVPEELLGQVADPTPSAEEALAFRQELALIHAVFAELDDRQRRIFYLSRIEGRTLAEIGEKFGMSTSAVHGQLTRILLRMQLRLDAGR